MSTNRTREIFDFAQLEPLAVDDITVMVQRCSEDEIDHVEQVAQAVLEAIGSLNSANGILELVEEET
jgi:hypothetical protein